MGNAGGTAGWFFSSEEKTPVVLRLNDARSVKLGKGEELQAMIRIVDDDSQVSSLTRHEPAALSVGTDTVIILEFFAVAACASSASSRADARVPGGSRPLGDVRLPLEHVAQRCGRGLYHMWFPLSAPWPQRDEVNLNLHPNGTVAGNGDMLDQFDRSLRNAARDPRWPIVSLSLCPANSSEASRSMHDMDMGAGEKSLHFPALFHSQAQHARLLQALYRICRSAQQQGVADLNASARSRDGLSDSWVSPEVCAAAGLASGAADIDALSEEIAQVQEDIATTTEEANSRIKQASEAIRTLKERISSRHLEHDRLRRDTQRLYHDANLLEVENQRIERSLQQGETSMAGGNGGGASGHEDPEEEAKRLRRDLEVLKEQKEALMLILQDLYGAVGPNGGASGGSPAPGTTEEQRPANAEVPPVTLSSSAQNLPGADHGKDAIGIGDLAGGYPAGTTAARGGASDQAWTNLLPRPSVLLLESELDDEY